VRPVRLGLATDCLSTLVKSSLPSRRMWRWTSITSLPASVAVGGTCQGRGARAPEADHLRPGTRHPRRIARGGSRSWQAAPGRL